MGKAPGHYVVCVNCGRQFDSTKGGYYSKETRRYTCKSCGRKLRKDYRERKTGMRQSMGAMIAKIVVGIIFIISSFQLLIDGEWGAFICGSCMGIAFGAWGLIPYFMAKQNDDTPQE